MPSPRKVCSVSTARIAVPVVPNRSAYPASRVRRGEKADPGANALRRTIARWLVGRLRTVTVSADEASVFSKDKLIANLTVPTVTVPLTLDAPEDSSWLTNFSFPVLVNVTDNTSDLTTVAQEAWRSAVLLLSATARNVVVNGGVKGDASWRRKLNLAQDVVTIPSRIRSEYR